MAVVQLGNVSAIAYNGTQDKVLNVTTPMATGTLLVAISLGYGSDGTIDLTSVTDSNGNTWQGEWVKAASPSRFALVAWTRIAAPMDSSDTVTINLTGTHTRSFAVLRGYEGLGDTPHGQNATTGASIPATVGAIAHGGPGRAIAACFYASQYSEADFWINGFGQTVVTQDIPNVDMYTVGERAYSGSGTVTPSNNIGQSTAWAMAAVALPESPMPGVGRRRSRVIAAGI